MNISRIVFGTVLFSLFIGLAPPTYATEKMDIMVGLKTLPVLSKKISSPAILAIVFDPNNPESVSDANMIKRTIDDIGIAPGDVALSTRMVSSKNLNKLHGTRIAFLARGVSLSTFDDVSNIASKEGILTISTDLDCVKNNKCVLGVISKPSIEIYYSQESADKAHINFVPAFTMLAKQI